ncbi:hypothetical protein C2G38_2145319, partial [Gigaspora rosea]
MIGVGYCTKPSDKKTDNSNIKPDMPGENMNRGYHGDDGYSFCARSGEPYGPVYATGDIIDCYINFI